MRQELQVIIILINSSRTKKALEKAIITSISEDYISVMLIKYGL